MVSPSLGAPALFTETEGVLSTGCVLSIVIPASVEVTAVPALPAVSPNVIEYPTAPSSSALSTTIVHVHPVASPVAVDEPPFVAIAPLPSVKAQTGAVVTSVLDVKVIVMVSPSLGAPTLSTETEGVLSVGLNVSTAKFDVVAVVPVLPAVSVQVFANATVLLLSS